MRNSNLWILRFGYYSKSIFPHLRGLIKELCLKGMVLVFISVIFISSSAQKVTAVVNRDKIRLGEQFELKLKVEPITNAPLKISSWFVIPDTFAHFQILHRSLIDTLNIATTNSYQQIIILTSFDSGTFTIPEFSVFINGVKIKTQEKSINVVPIDVSQRKDYNDIKDILEPEVIENDSSLWGAYILTLVLGVFIFFYFKWLLTRRKNQGFLPLKKVSIEKALHQLNALVLFIHSKQYKLFCTELITICRSFSDYQLQVKTQSKTTHEYEGVLKKKNIKKDLLQQYMQLLHWADQVKFAKSIPTTAECQNKLAEAKTILMALSAVNETIKEAADAR